jgi:hypothetical protein
MNSGIFILAGRTACGEGEWGVYQFFDYRSRTVSFNFISWGFAAGLSSNNLLMAWNSALRPASLIILYENIYIFTFIDHTICRREFLILDK